MFVIVYIMFASDFDADVFAMQSSNKNQGLTLLTIWPWSILDCYQTCIQAECEQVQT